MTVIWISTERIEITANDAWLWYTIGIKKKEEEKKKKMFNAKNSKSNESQNNFDNWWCLKVNERIRCAPFDFRVCNIRFDAVSMTFGIHRWMFTCMLRLLPIQSQWALKLIMILDYKRVQERKAHEYACVCVFVCMCAFNANYRLLHAIHQTVEKLFENNYVRMCEFWCRRAMRLQW